MVSYFRILAKVDLRTAGLFLKPETDSRNGLKTPRLDVVVVQRLLGILGGLFQRGCLNNAVAKSGEPLCTLWRRAPDGLN